MKHTLGLDDIEFLPVGVIAELASGFQRAGAIVAEHVIENDTAASKHPAAKDLQAITNAFIQVAIDVNEAEPVLAQRLPSVSWKQARPNL